MEDSDRLGRWLLHGDLAARASGEVEQEIVLDAPTSVCLIRRTVEPCAGGGLTVRPDP